MDNNNRKPWIKFTVLEAVARSVNQSLQKVVGLASLGLGHTFIATTVYSLVQTLASIGIILVRKTSPIKWPTYHIVGACCFGLLAFAAAAIGFNAFRLHADIGVYVFIIVLSIIPSAIIGRVVFKEKLTLRMWLGIGVAILGGYLVVGPTFKTLEYLPVWFWLALAASLFVAINQGITRLIRGIDPMVKNVWGGGTFLVSSIGALFVVGGLDLPFRFDIPAIPKLWLVGAIMGLVVIVLWSANLLSYTVGAEIAPKKLVADTTFLTLSMLSGILFFGEPASIAKFVAIPIFVVAYLLIEKPRVQVP